MLTGYILCTTGTLPPKPETSASIINQESGDRKVEATACSTHAKIGDCPNTDNSLVHGTNTPAEQAAIIDKLQQQVAAMMRQMDLHNLMAESSSARVSSPTGNVHQYTLLIVWLK